MKAKVILNLCVKDSIKEKYATLKHYKQKLCFPIYQVNFKEKTIYTLWTVGTVIDNGFMASDLSEIKISALYDIGPVTGVILIQIVNGPTPARKKIKRALELAPHNSGVVFIAEDNRVLDDDSLFLSAIGGKPEWIRPLIADKDNLSIKGEILEYS